MDLNEFTTEIKGQPNKNYYFITIPLKLIRLLKANHRKPLKVTFRKNKDKTTFITTVNLGIRNRKLKRAIVHVNRYVRKILNLKFKDKVIVKVEKPKFLNYRPKKIFKNGKVDFLALVPEDILVIEDNGNLVLWRRPRTRSIEIRRFMDIEISARFFGLLFSEGHKCKNTTGAYLNIATKEIEPHIIVVTFLRNLLGNDKLIQGYCQYKPGISKHFLEVITKSYEKATKISVKPIPAKKLGNYTFATNVNSTLLGELLLHSLKVISTLLLNEKLRNELKMFAESFIAEELTGDGSLSVGKFFTITIGDEDNYRRTILKSVLGKLGLNAKDNGKLILSFDATSAKKRLYLINIGAFKGKNREKLIRSITKLKILNLQMQRLKVFLNTKFDNRTICEKFGWPTTKATKWLNSMRKKGYISPVKRIGHSIFYEINKTNPVVQFYLKWEEEFKKLLKN